MKLIHQENGGLSRAQNKGFENATAGWIVNYDLDDWYDFNAIALIVKA
ncbi:MAG: glycosyltransferase [Eggerthellaceae bacterium]|nr:glycosyltransferase [Eggerthellaceae bacterium]